MSATAAQAATFGGLLRRYRLDIGLTQEELAERAQIGVRCISDIERGMPRRPRRETLRLLAEALSLSREERDDFVSAGRGRLIPRVGPVQNRESALSTRESQSALGVDPTCLSPADEPQTSLVQALNVAANRVECDLLARLTEADLDYEADALLRVLRRRRNAMRAAVIASQYVPVHDEERNAFLNMVSATLSANAVDLLNVALRLNAHELTIARTNITKWIAAHEGNTKHAEDHLCCANGQT